MEYKKVGNIYFWTDPETGRVIEGDDLRQLKVKVAAYRIGKRS